MTLMIGPYVSPYNRPGYHDHAHDRPHKYSAGCEVGPKCTPFTPGAQVTERDWRYHADDRRCTNGGKRGGCEELHWFDPVGDVAIANDGPDRREIRRKLNEANLIRKRKVVAAAEVKVQELKSTLGEGAKAEAVGYAPPPDHYATGVGIQPWDVWDAFDLDRYTANATKYLLRAGKKPGEGRLKDLKKALNYVHKAIEMEEKRDG